MNTQEYFKIQNQKTFKDLYYRCINNSIDFFNKKEVEKELEDQPLKTGLLRIYNIGIHKHRDFKN